MLDEILAVGDESFSHKCLDRMREFKERKKTIVLVTHDAGLIESWCDTALWMDRGKAKLQGPAERVVDAYHREHAQPINGRRAAQREPVLGYSEDPAHRGVLPAQRRWSAGSRKADLRGASERGHEVTVATSNCRPARAARGGRPDRGLLDFRQRGVGFRGRNERYKKFLIEGKFDVMMNYAAQQWATDLAFSVLGKFRTVGYWRRAAFLRLHDRSYAGYFREMPAVLLRYDRLVFHSTDYRDAVLLKGTA